jgi:hypothetical protein
VAFISVLIAKPVSSHFGHKDSAAQCDSALIDDVVILVHADLQRRAITCMDVTLLLLKHNSNTENMLDMIFLLIPFFPCFSIELMCCPL